MSLDRARFVVVASSAHCDRPVLRAPRFERARCDRTIAASETHPWPDGSVLCRYHDRERYGETRPHECRQGRHS